MSQSLAETPTINKNCAITNNSTVDIMVLDAFADSNAPTAEQIYEQTLKLLSTTDGQKVIKAGATGTVVLDDYHTDDSGTQLYTKIYDLIIAKADNLYPIGSKPEILSSSKADPPSSYKPITISADDIKNMQLAENFYQTIMAYPTSNLAKGFQAAVSGATDTANSDTAIDDAVSKFFSSTTQYKNVTLNMVVAITTYYSQYPFVWASYKSSKTYYLYTSDGTKCSYVGSVQITVPSTVPASTDKTLPGFNITYTNASNSTKKLYYSNGQFVDDVNSDMPGICLQGLFTLKSQLTKKDTDNTVIAILSGTVNNNKVLGYDEKQTQDSSGNWSGLYTLLHPKDAMGWIQLLMTFGGIIMTLDFFSKGLKSLKDGILKETAENDGEAPSPSEVEALRTQVKGLKTQVDITNQKLLDKMDANLEVSKDLNKSMEELQSRIQDRLNEDQRSLLDDSLETQSDLLESVLEYGNNKNLVDIDDMISNNMDKLDNATTEELVDVLPEVKISVGNITLKLKLEVERVSSKADQEAKDSMEKSQEELKEAEEMSDKIDDSAEDAETGDVPDDMEFEPVEM